MMAEDIHIILYKTVVSVISFSAHERRLKSHCQKGCIWEDFEVHLLQNLPNYNIIVMIVYYLPCMYSFVMNI